MVVYYGVGMLELNFDLLMGSVFFEEMWIGVVGVLVLVWVNEVLVVVVCG